MRIPEEHKTRGAALYQIATDPKFTSINKISLYESRSAFGINSDTGVYLKHRAEPTTARGEYTFGFSWDERFNIQKLSDKYKSTFVILICEEDREICCLDYERELLPLFEKRNDSTYETSTLYVRLPPGEGFFINMFQKGSTTRWILREQERVQVPRNAFPRRLFE